MDRPTDIPTDGHTDIVTYTIRFVADKKCILKHMYFKAYIPKLGYDPQLDDFLELDNNEVQGRAIPSMQ